MVYGHGGKSILSMLLEEELALLLLTDLVCAHHRLVCTISDDDLPDDVACGQHSMFVRLTRSLDR